MTHVGQKEVLIEIKKYFKQNENENKIHQNLGDVAKAVLRRKFISLRAFIRKEESHISSQSVTLRN